MTLWAIGDLHLSFTANKPMDRFGPVWTDHADKIERNFWKYVKPSDTVVLVGDHSWGRNLEECRKDLEFIDFLPGRKILIRGNHDMFWKVSRTAELNRLYEGRLHFLQNNFSSYEDYALVGTKGYCYEGKDDIAHFEKLRDRELARLENSFRLAREAGYRKFIVFLHYPPTSIGEQESPFTQMAEAYGASKVIYAHCHGRDRFDDSFKGMVNGIDYRLVSGDFLRFKPARILPEKRKWYQVLTGL